ncbi:hypothetical protein BJY01DRAFT_215308 [Aspergillus pseudoustus]|uniref:polynucleotide adenylyltransferase n=1 Tax=Aspergillus pseudoustus TaxID=1810923 RepID=A0ABR4JV57_9EURO
MALPRLITHDTALCILPPSDSVRDIERLGALYDKAYGRWPPHLNLIYPFAEPELLPQAAKIVRQVIYRRRLRAQNDDNSTPTRLRLDKAGFFAHRRNSTIYRYDSGSAGLQALLDLRQEIFDAFEYTPSRDSPLHLTVGQSEDDLASRQFLLEKTALLPVAEFEVGELVILVRDRSQEQPRMEVWGRISLAGECALSRELGGAGEERDTATTSSSPVNGASKAEAGITFRYAEEDAKWVAVSTSSPTAASLIESSLTIASYNVLIDIPYPPPTERYPILLGILLSPTATADILILQEVSDEFLSFLLADPEIRHLYPFTTHGPPDQPDISPLSSLRNTVALTKYPFTWEWLPFEKRHKGAVVLQLDTGPNSKPLVVTGVHLTCGLSDGSILAKQSQLQSVLRHLATNHADSDWIVAGDFNIPTSSYTLDAALKRKAISPQAAATLSSLDGMLARAGLSDTYFAGRAGGAGGDLGTLEVGALYEGEEGATFDPAANDFAARIAGQSFHSRPQRYDRILVRGERFDVASFNMFGLPSEDAAGEEGALGSDHWGIRTVLDLTKVDTDLENTSRPTPKASIEIAHAPASLTHDSLMHCLREANTFPSTEEITHRQVVIQHLRTFINERDPNLSVDTRLTLSFAVVPVGSYGLGVWTLTSDIDILAIGTVSPRTFFMLMVSKIRRASLAGQNDIRLLRKVNAASGTMLELDVRGVRVDLQYCAATRVAETWPQALSLPASDPTFDIPMHSLLKLNPLRDMHYLQRTIPDLASFRLAYRFIKTWAQRRGIYSSKLGYLGGIHITLLLARVCKLSFSSSAGPISALDLIPTFFRTYARTNWARETIFDNTFYSSPPRYFRTAREPMVILTQHTPKVNVARSAAVPSARTLEGEFARMDALLADAEGLEWADLTGAADTGVEDFLKAYPSYVKVNVQHWGAGGSQGRMLVGWLEWRCVTLLVDIHRKFPDIHARIWPARFTDMDPGEGETGDNQTNEEYQGCYLIGLSKSSAVSKPAVATTADRQSAEIALLSVLNSFADQIRSDEKYFDASSSWIDVTVASQSAVRGLHVDTSVLVIEDLYDEDEEEEEDLLDPTDDSLDEEANERAHLPLRTRVQTASSPGPRLRPASDVLSRLRWDSNIDIDDYIVGYDDRFLGEREMPVAQWKAELTDEAFIPGHRILYFRRKSDGVKVWDRERRVDLLFNSGVSGSV